MVRMNYIDQNNWSFEQNGYSLIKIDGKVRKIFLGDDGYNPKVWDYMMTKVKHLINNSPFEGSFQYGLC